MLFSIGVCSQDRMALFRLQFFKQDSVPPAAQSCFEISLCDPPGVAPQTIEDVDTEYHFDSHDHDPWITESV